MVKSCTSFPCSPAGIITDTSTIYCNHAKGSKSPGIPSVFFHLYHSRRDVPLLTRGPVPPALRICCARNTAQGSVHSCSARGDSFASWPAYLASHPQHAASSRCWLIGQGLVETSPCMLMWSAAAATAVTVYCSLQNMIVMNTHVIAEACRASAFILRINSSKPVHRNTVPGRSKGPLHAAMCYRSGSCFHICPSSIIHYRRVVSVATNCYDR